MKRFILAACAAALLTSAPPAFAGDVPPPTGAKAGVTTPVDAGRQRRIELSKRMFKAMHMDVLMDTMMRQVLPAVMAEQTKELPESVKSAMGDSMAETMQAIMPAYMERVAEVYADTFTEEELSRTVEFYESDIGQSLMNKTPGMTPRITQIMVDLMPAMKEDMMRRFCAKTDCGKPGPAADRKS